MQVQLNGQKIKKQAVRHDRQGKAEKRANEVISIADARHGEGVVEWRDRLEHHSQQYGAPDWVIIQLAQQPLRKLAIQVAERVAAHKPDGEKGGGA